MCDILLTDRFKVKSSLGKIRSETPRLSNRAKSAKHSCRNNQ